MRSRLFILLGMLIFILFFSSCINIKPTFTDQDKFFSSEPEKTDLSVYGSPPSAGVLPIFNSNCHSGNIYEIKKLALSNFKGDSIYHQIEMQEIVYNGETIVIVLIYQHDDKMIDIYYPDEIVLSKANFEKLLNHVEMCPSTYESSFCLTDHGFEMKLNLTDKFGRLIWIDFSENKPGGEFISLIAPIGSGTKEPQYFPFIFIDKFGFLRKNCGTSSLKIGKSEMKLDKIPFTPYYLTRYSLETTLAEWLPNTEKVMQLSDTMPAMGNTYQVVNNGGYIELATQTFNYYGRNFHVNYMPPIPDLLALKDNQNIEGKFCARTDSVSGIMAGTYSITKKDGKISMKIEPEKGWQPYPGKLWLKTYRWEATILPENSKEVKVKTEWNRVK